ATPDNPALPKTSACAPFPACCSRGRAHSVRRNLLNAFPRTSALPFESFFIFSNPIFPHCASSFAPTCHTFAKSGLNIGHSFLHRSFACPAFAAFERRRGKLQSISHPMHRLDPLWLLRIRLQLRPQTRHVIIHRARRRKRRISPHNVQEPLPRHRFPGGFRQ